MGAAPRRLAAIVLLGALCCCCYYTQVSRAESVGYGELEEEWRGEVVQLSWKPRAFHIKGFLSEEECDHIINTSKPQLEESLVVNSDTGKFMKSTVRTSLGAQFGRGFDAVFRRIEKRIASVTMIPVEHQEGTQVLHYVNGQKYDVHYDTFHDTVNSRKENGGQRIVTFLMYLSTPEEGGETVFPFADLKVSGPGWSECALQGFAHKPKRGDAMMFYSLTPDGKVDPASQHGSCPTLKGTKWSATKWIHIYPFGMAPPTPDPNGCEDTNESCAEWAFFDECTKNPGYMLTGCKKSCKTCWPAAAGAQAEHSAGAKEALKTA